MFSSYPTPSRKLYLAAAAASTLAVAAFLLYPSFPRPPSSIPLPYPSDRSTQCLSLYAPHPPPIQHVHQHCSSMPSAHPAFALQLCHDPAICNAFTLRIAPTRSSSCLALERANRSLSDDPGLDAWIKSAVGPDTFEIRTDGAERVAPTPIYEGACHWRFDVSLRNPGPVFLHAWHTYQYYHAFDEKNGSWPIALKTPLFSDSVQLNICSPSCASVPPAHIDPHRKLLTYPPAPASYTPPRLPPCSDTEPVSGSYLPVHYLELLHPSARLPQSEEPGVPVAGRYRFVPHGCEWKHSGRRFEDHDRCLRNKKKIVVVGDSHGRVAADGLFHRFEGRRDIMTASEKLGHKSYEIRNMNMEFWDPKGADASCAPGGTPLEDADVLIMSVAQHFVWSPTTEYVAELRRLLQLYAACPRPESRGPLRLVYLTTPAWPARDDYYVSNFGDQRTNARLGRWAEIGVRMAQEEGWRVVDQFALSRPHVWEVLMLDKAHFLGTDALDAILDEVIGKAGVCD